MICAALVPAHVSEGPSYRLARLRQVDPMRSDMARRLRLSASPGITLAQLDVDRLYLALDVLMHHTSHRMFWSVDDLCRIFFGDYRVPSASTDPGLVVTIASDVLLESGIDFGMHHFHVERVCSALFGRKLRNLLFAHDTPCGKLFSETLLQSSLATPDVRLAHLPVPLRWRVACTFLDRLQLATLRTGDVIRVSAWRPTVYAERYAVCPFTFDGETVVVQRHRSDAEDPNEVGPLAQEQFNETPLPFDRIPLACEFLLPIREFKLDELNALTEGAVLPLDNQALRAVEMRIGKHCVALGELVQVGDAIGFEVNRVLIT